MIHYYRYPIIDNFNFIKTVDYKNDLFLSKNYKIKSTLLQNHILKISCKDKNNHLKNYSELNPVEIINNNIKRHITKNKVIYSDGLFKIEFCLKQFSLKIIFKNEIILNSDINFIGYNGSKIIYQFKKKKDTPFWGFGEKTDGINKKGKVLKMWNIDTMVEMPDSFKKNNYDPTYISIPFFIIQINNINFGFLLDNPGETFFNNGKENKNHFYFGSYDGKSTLYIIYGPSLKDVLKKLTILTGKIDIPPLWSIGYHQARFSYLSDKEVKNVINNFIKHEIPLSSIWLDIDYMDEYKIFTWNKKYFKKPKKLINWIHSKKIKLVTIIDPGVKKDKNYFIYNEGKQLNIFCKTHNKKEYIGTVWPGETVFPDFVCKKAQKWWSEKIAQFLKTNIDGIWIDMNDPSTGVSEADDMLFSNGKIEHKYYHNQYANLMAKATKEGFHKFNPNKRSFILSRSAYTGIQKYSAVWTGDNVSSWAHLQMSIPQSLNLSLSGVSFTGDDVGGFIDDTNEQLIIRWYQANYLFPFFRNHSSNGTKYQEPYQFSKKGISIIKKFINLRYKFLPYLYNLFYNNHQEGQPILRPIFFEFNNKKHFDCNDTFMVGPFILQAPILTSKNIRWVSFPNGYWFNYFKNKWIKGDCNKKFITPLNETLMFIRDGSIIPVLTGKEFSCYKKRDFNNVEFNVYIKEKKHGNVIYYEDDGKSYEYKKGIYNLYKINIVLEKNDFNFHIVKNHFKFQHGLKEFKFNIYFKNKIFKKVIKV